MHFEIDIALSINVSFGKMVISDHVFAEVWFDNCAHMIPDDPSLVESWPYSDNCPTPT